VTTCLVLCKTEITKSTSCFVYSRLGHISDVLEDVTVSDCFVPASCCLLNGRNYADRLLLVVSKESCLVSDNLVLHETSWTIMLRYTRF